MNSHFARYAQTYLRGGLYFAAFWLASFNTFIAGFTAEQLGALDRFGWLILLAKISTLPIGTLVTFLDGTFERTKVQSLTATLEAIRPAAGTQISPI